MSKVCGLITDMEPGWLEVSENDWPLIVGIPPCDDKDPFVVCTVESCDHGISGQFHFTEDIAKANARTIAAIPDLILELREALECLRCTFNKTDAGPRPCSQVFGPCDCEMCRQYLNGLAALKKAGCK